MDLTKAFLPDAVMVSGKVYKIKTGHSFWFVFARIIGQDKKYLSDFDFLYDGDIPEDRQAGVDALCGFYCEKKEVPRLEDDGSDRVLDYDIDADYIYSAILQCYGIDLFDKQIHWHKVRAMLAAVNNTRLNDIMQYRGASGKNKELAKLKRIWALPEKQSEEDKAALERFNAQFD